MKYFLAVILSIVLAVASLIINCQQESPTPLNPNSPSQSVLDKKGNGSGQSTTVSVFATGFNNPRGLKFGPDGYLYVAEGGLGGNQSTIGICDQVVPPIGPYTGGMTGRISKVSPTGVRSTVVDNLPSDQTSAITGNLVSGVADVAFIGNTLYAIFAGAGCSHGVSEWPNGIIRVNADGSWDMIADLSAWQQSHPVANPEEDDFEPDGTWYSMINVRGNLYAVEPNHGEMVKVTPSGDISRVIDISATQGHIVPTAMDFHGNFFIGNLFTFPIVEGSSNIYKVTPSGQIKIWQTGFTTILGVAIDQRDRMYVLENTTGSHPGPTPWTGEILRVEPSGSLEVIADSLFLPTAMTFGPDGALYVSNKGFGPPVPGFGEILKIELQ
jgi:hypothetical protein